MDIGKRHSGAMRDVYRDTWRSHGGIWRDSWSEGLRGMGRLCSAPVAAACVHGRFRIPGRLPDTMESFGGKVQEEEAWRRSQENRRTARRNHPGKNRNGGRSCRKNSSHGSGDIPIVRCWHCCRAGHWDFPSSSHACLRPWRWHGRLSRRGKASYPMASSA